MIVRILEILMLWNIFTATHTKKPTKQTNNHKNISSLLNNLLQGYDNSIRPDFGGKIFLNFWILNTIMIFLMFGGPPAIVEVDIMVRSMGPISEVDMVRIR